MHTCVQAQGWVWSYGPPTESGCVSTEQLAHKGAPSCGRVLLTVEGGRTAKSYTQRCAQPEPRSGDLRVPGRGAAAQPRSGTFFSIKMGHRSRPYGTHCKRCFIFLTLWSCKTRLSSTRGQSGPVEGVSTRWRARRLRCAQAQGSRAARGTTERSSGPCCAHCLVGRSATRPTWLLAPVGVGAATPPPYGSRRDHRFLRARTIRARVCKHKCGGCCAANSPGERGCCVAPPGTRKAHPNARPCSGWTVGGLRRGRPCA